MVQVNPSPSGHRYSSLQRKPFGFGLQLTKLTILQSAEVYELREKSLGSVHSMHHLEEPGLTRRTASALTVLTVAALEGTVPTNGRNWVTGCYFQALIKLK